MSDGVPVFEGVINFRDLASASSDVQPGRVFRSARLCFACVADVVVLQENLGVATLVDLRTDREFERDQDPATPIETACADGIFERHRVSILDPERLKKGMARRLSVTARIRAAVTMMFGGRDRVLEAIRPALNAAGLVALNEILLAGSSDEIVRALRLLADPGRHPLVFYCTAGKDRTGLLAAIVLLSLGVSEAAVLSDYARSHDHYARFLSDSAYGGQLVEAGLDPEVFLSARPEVMEQTFAHLRERYGGVEGWLDQAGFDAEARNDLARSLRR